MEKQTIQISSANTTTLNKIYSKISWRLLPFLLLCYFFAYLDRINIGFAKLQMQGEIGFSDSVYGLAAGMFFLGYVLFEVPSNLLLVKIGARKTIFRIMVLWGLTSASMLFVTSPTTFYILRFLLGVFEAGFAPGMIFYLSYWYSGERMARVMAIVMLAGPIGGMLGGPISTYIMDLMHGVYTMSGWQWLFLIEGLPAVLLGFITLFYLDDNPAEAKWLTPKERSVLVENIEKKKDLAHSGFGKVLKDPWIYFVALGYFCLISGIYAVSFWLPTLIQSSGIDNLRTIGLYSALPYLMSAIFMYLLARSSDRRQERRWHITIPTIISSIFLAIAITFDSNFYLSFALISLATGLIWAAYTVFWALPAQYLEGSAAAGGIALINSIGLLGGFFSPFLIGFVKTLTGSFVIGWLSISGLLFVGGIILYMSANRKSKGETA